ncbi:ABC transporter substrate-binding protein [Actinophytocola xinjiangensis]|uniref:ABC transporter substrate-binding protein n=1 Tax=Actinophytocola xinjiangensis TaxID=485602 RepID=A0A7Z0WJ81_9PSEU|nr:MCE family protein [Actinophytocola xinjiangensis]OLF06466.1 ABC transporter substrate-binding protein [Actinophytocola xinjiangensis]
MKVRYPLYGVVFLVIAALFVALSIAFYRKTFVEVVPVRLETSHAGNQLRVGSDVKLRGVVVGEVRAVRAEGDLAVLDLALDPDTVAGVPANVTARLLPKTLFGERYVALQAPAGPAPPIGANAVIGQDRSSTAVELEQVLDNLMPLLRTVRPDKLASALGAVSTALDGQGARLGDTIASLGDHLGELEPALPDLRADLRALATVADTYAVAGPELVTALRDLTTTTGTIAEQRSTLASLYGEVTNASVDLRSFLAANQDNLIDLVATARPTLEVLAKYAPEYPCVLGQLVDAIPAADRAFGKGTAHPNVTRVTIEITASRGKYVPGRDTPRYDDRRGPRCYPVAKPPARFPQYPAGGPLADGSTKPPPPRSDRPQDFLPTGPQAAASAPALANSPAERDLLAALLAPQLGVEPAAVPRWASLLVGPLYRGAEVELR